MKIVRVCSRMNPWVDCIVFITGWMQENDGKNTINRGLDEWLSEKFDTYGDAIETNLSEAGIEYDILYGYLNEDETDTIPEWDAFWSECETQGDVELIVV